MGVMRRLDWLARRRMQGTLSGRHTSPDKGVSVEFAEHRSYAPGDDPRTLDWKIMARSDKDVVRQYIEETNLRVTLAVDVSGSMAYTGEKAAELDGNRDVRRRIQGLSEGHVGKLGIDAEARPDHLDHRIDQGVDELC